MRYKYRTRGVCSQEISFDINGNVITNIEFFGGCPGNLKAIAKVVDGKTVEEIEELISDISCGNKPTSCSAQLAHAVREAYEASKAI